MHIKYIVNNIISYIFTIRSLLTGKSETNNFTNISFIHLYFIKFAKHSNNNFYTITRIKHCYKYITIN